MKLTDAERAVLLWLTDDAQMRRTGARRGRWTGGSLVAYYEAREKAACAAEGRNYWWSTDRGHAWRRTGGRLLARMARAGALANVGFVGAERGTGYVLTPAGEAEAKRLRDEAPAAPEGTNSRSETGS